MLLLREGERSVSELMEALGGLASRMSQPAFSQHLGVLRRAGLVNVRRDGRRRLYSLRREGLAEVAEWVHEFDAFWDDRLNRLGSYLDSGRDEGAPG